MGPQRLGRLSGRFDGQMRAGPQHLGDRPVRRCSPTKRKTSGRRPRSARRSRLTSPGCRRKPMISRRQSRPRCSWSPMSGSWPRWRRGQAQGVGEVPQNRRVVVELRHGAPAPPPPRLLRITGHVETPAERAKRVVRIIRSRCLSASGARTAQSRRRGRPTRPPPLRPDAAPLYRCGSRAASPT